MKKFFRDFKKFITKGNIVDLAVAVVIGAAFGKIVSSLVADVIMPLIAFMVGGVSIAQLKWVIRPAVYDANGILVTAENALRYGNFLQTILDFLIIALFIFIALRILSKAKNNLEKFSVAASKMNKPETKAFIKKLKAQGKTSSEIKVAVTEFNKQMELAAAAQEAIKKAEVEAAKPETQEKILSDIRELLANQAKKE